MVREQLQQHRVGHLAVENDHRLHAAPVVVPGGVSFTFRVIGRTADFPEGFRDDGLTATASGAGASSRTGHPSA